MKRLIVLALVAAIALTGAMAQAKPVKLVFTSVSVPGDAHTQAMKVFKDEVEKLSGGQITVDLYDSGQLFTQQAEQDAVRQGKVDIVYAGDAWLAPTVPYLSMFGAAYTFQSYEQMTKTFNGPIGKKIFDDVARSQGIRPLMAFYLGTRELNLTAKVGPVTNPDQMKNVKFRVPNSPVWIALGRALGANPTPMAFGEVYMGLKTGTIDGQDNPLLTDKSAKFYEVTKYIVLTNHVIGSVWPTINEKKWESLTPQQQGWVMQAMETARQFCDKTNLDAEKTLLDFFRANGITVIENPDRAAFAAYAKNFYLNDAKELSSSWDWKLYDEVQKLK
ncbi:MAG TPA: sialic acid TRAP transporter substrate-binding protein SiaP [Rectinemataceae bacterium]|nr:sialic acid TRAP transporter substrate-binding protein SiaP [Rectinemataceae bacterium]